MMFLVGISLSCNVVKSSEGTDFTYPAIEVNLFDFDDDIYGEDITLEFISFLRLEFKMCGLDELKCQLTKDRENAKRLLNEYLTTKQ